MVRYSRYVIFRMMEAPVPQVLFREIFDRIRRVLSASLYEMIHSRWYRQLWPAISA